MDATNVFSLSHYYLNSLFIYLILKSFIYKYNAFSRVYERRPIKICIHEKAALFTRGATASLFPAKLLDITSYLSPHTQSSIKCNRLQKVTGSVTISDHRRRSPPTNPISGGVK